MSICSRLWLKVLKADSRAIFSVASYASQAADWLLKGLRSRRKEC
jgi:antirestriction protein ArdC